MKMAILVAVAALAVLGLAVGVVAAQAINAPHASSSGAQAGYGGGMMGGTNRGGMMGGQYGGGMMGGGSCGCGNYAYCQQYMYDHNYTWNYNYSYGTGGMMG